MTGLCYGRMLMQHRPDKVRDTTPAIAIRDGSGLGWQHLAATAYCCLRADEGCEVPAAADTYSVKIQTSVTPVELEWDFHGSEKALWTPGTMAFLPIGESTRWHWSAPIESLIFGVRLEYWNRLAAEMYGKDGPSVQLRPMFKPDDEALRQLLLMLAEEFHAGGPNGPLFAEGLSLALVSRLLRQHSTQPPTAEVRPGPLPRWKLQRIQEYVEAHLTHTITLADLAQAVDSSPAYFARAFRRSTGVPPYRYVLRQRILRAMNLVLNSDLDFGDIAVSTGFSSHSHFSTTFRNFTRMTPADFRRSRQGSR